MADLSERVRLIEYWKDGNGSRGAEARIQDVEVGVRDLRESCGHFMTDEDTEKMVHAAFRGFVNAARDKDKTTVAKIKAWSPIIVAGGAVLTALIPLVIK